MGRIFGGVSVNCPNLARKLTITLKSRQVSGFSSIKIEVRKVARLSKEEQTIGSVEVRLEGLARELGADSMQGLYRHSADVRLG